MLEEDIYNEESPIWDPNFQHPPTALHIPNATSSASGKLMLLLTYEKCLFAIRKYFFFLIVNHHQIDRKCKWVK